MKSLLFLSLLTFSSVSNAVVRFNNFTGYWEGNVCANFGGWTYVQFQPIGSFCQVFLPNGMVGQGQIINR